MSVLNPPLMPDSLIIEAIQDKKGRDITHIDLTTLSLSTAPRLIICTGNTPTQVAAIADSVRDRLVSDLKIKPLAYTGYKNSLWIVLDYGEVMVHVFVPDAREFYDIEQLWADGVITEVPNLD